LELSRAASTEARWELKRLGGGPERPPFQNIMTTREVCPFANRIMTAGLHAGQGFQKGSAGGSAARVNYPE
jgi:hypothetical protein